MKDIEIVKLPAVVKYEVEWNGVKFHIENVDGNLNVMFDGDINIGVSGELGIVSSNNVSIDTIGSKIYLNSRKSSAIKDMPESIEYREAQQLEMKKKQLMMAEEHDSFVKRIEKLEQQVRDLKCQV